MSEDVRRNGSGDLGAIGDALDKALHGAGAHAPRPMDGEVGFNDRLDPGGQGKNTSLRGVAIGATFAVDGQAMGLPVDVRRGERRELGNSEPSVQEDPNDETFLAGLAAISEAIGFVSGKRFALILVGHLLGSCVRVRV